MDLHFLNVKVFYIVKEGHTVLRKHQDLGLLQIHGNHTAKNLQTHIHILLQRWGLHSQDLNVLTTDSAANMLLAVEHLSVPSLRCLCHQVHLIVLECMNPGVGLFAFHTSEYSLHELFAETEVLVMDPDDEDADAFIWTEPEYDAIAPEVANAFTGLMDRVRQLVRKVRKSAHLSTMLKREWTNIQTTNETKEPFLKLTLDVKTRWNSTLHMMKRVLRNHTALEKILLGVDRLFLLSTQELHEVRSIVQSLSSMEKILLWLQRKKEDAANVYLLIMSTLQVLNSGESVFSQQLRMVLERRWGSTMNRDFYTKCHYLDPSKPKGRIRAEDLGAIDQLKEKYKEFGGETERRRVSHDVNPLQCVNSMDVLEVMQRNIEGEDFGRIQDKSEWDRFRELPKVSRSEDWSVLEWWAQHEKAFPVLFRLAMQYLNAPPSSAASERAFSIAGNIVRTKRNRLTSDSLSGSLFASCNRDPVSQ